MNEFVEFVVVFAVVITCICSVFLFVELFTSKWMVSLRNYFVETNFAIKSRNCLFKCNHEDCKRMYRKYQIDLLKGIKGDTLTCPHCGRGVKNPRNVWTSTDKHTRVFSEDKWMASHVDCPKINISGYIKIRKLIKNAERLKKEDSVQQRFEEYNQLEPNMDWIRNLQKK